MNSESHVGRFQRAVRGSGFSSFHSVDSLTSYLAKTVVVVERVVAVVLLTSVVEVAASAFDEAGGAPCAIQSRSS